MAGEVPSPQPEKAMNPEDLIEVEGIEAAAVEAVEPEAVDLGLDDSLTKAYATGEDFISDGESPEAGPKGKPVVESETAFNLDLWAQRRGLEMVQECDELRKLAKLAEQLADNAAGVAPRQPIIEREPTEDEKYWGSVAADFHTAAYDPEPERTEVCKDKLRSDFVSALMETQEFHEIRASTELDPVASEVATIAFASQFAKRLEEHKQQSQKGPQPGNGKKGGKSPAAADPTGEIATMRAAAQACVAAQQAIQETNDAMEMCGIGTGGGGEKRLDRKRLANLHKRIRRSDRLRRIAELAGKYRRLAQGKQRMKVVHGTDDVLGVTLGDEITKLLPMELAMLTDDEFGLETARRFLEKQTMQYQTQATEKAGKGPIVVTVDESGSMEGNKIETAKALALALAWIARRQKRFCVLIGFSGGTEGTKLIIPPGKADEVKLLDWLDHFFGNGTDMDVPLMKLQEWWPEFIAAGMARGKTDIIMITDAEVRVPEEFAKSFNGFKAEEKVKMQVLVVQGSAGNIATVADEVFNVPAITLDSDAVGEVLSI